MKEKPLWSVVLIVKDEAKTLPKALASLVEFKARGGEIVVVDTGSKDETARIAKAFGCKVEEVGARFVTVIDKETADRVNAYFLVDDEPAILKDGDKLFDFAAARNYAASLSPTDFIVCMDADEMFEALDIEAINQAIKDGYTQIQYQYQYAPTVSFRQVKSYDRRAMKWRCAIHEVLEGEAKLIYLEPSKFFLRHEQNKETDRTGYLRALALDCFNHPEADRQSHYMGRELYYTGRWKSAIKELERHASMKKWPAEAAQSLNFAGTCWERLGAPERAVETWNRAIAIDATRREPFILLSQFYLNRKDYLRAMIYANAALQLPLVDYYANDLSHYREVPHGILYTALWYLNRKDEARTHYDKAFAFSPENDKIRSDRQFFY